MIRTRAGAGAGVDVDRVAVDDRDDGPAGRRAAGVRTAQRHACAHAEARPDQNRGEPQTARGQHHAVRLRCQRTATTMRAARMTPASTDERGREGARDLRGRGNETDARPGEHDGGGPGVRDSRWSTVSVLPVPGGPYSSTPLLRCCPRGAQDLTLVADAHHVVDDPLQHSVREHDVVGLDGRTGEERRSRVRPVLGLRERQHLAAQNAPFDHEAAYLGERGARGLRVRSEDLQPRGRRHGVR